MSKSYIVATHISSNIAVSTKSVSEIIGKLECGKSAVSDGIGAEYLKFSNIKIHVLLPMCFTLCLAHSYLPPAMIETTIVPIVKGVPLFIIKLLVFWYSRQRMFLRWGDTCSTSFCVTNGVKQGGIISPMLFNLCMDDLRLMLNCSGIGGYIGTSFINHLC